MVATRQIASDVAGVACAVSADRYCSPVTGGLFLATAIADATITFRTAGTISNLSIRAMSGNRTSGNPRVEIFKNGSLGNSVIVLAPAGTPLSTPSEYEDAVNTDAIAAGDTVTIHVHGGGSGNANWTFNHIGFIFTADSGTITHFGANGPLNYATASETSYRHPACGDEKTTTQANGEWRVKLPAGVTGVTIQKLYVRCSGNTRTTNTVISINGATGAGTPPSVTIAGSSGAAVGEDTANAIIAQDGDLISFKVITGTGTGTLVMQEIAVEVSSPDGVSFFIAGSPTGAAVTATNTGVAIGGMCGVTTTEARSQAKIGLERTLSLMSSYWSDGTTVTGTLRAGGADAGTPGAMATASADNSWVTDSTNTYAADDLDVINYRMTRTGTATAHCFAITVAAAGGTTFEHPLSGALTFGGSIARQTGKPSAAGLSFAGALTRQSGKVLAAVQSFVGALLRRADRPMSGELSFAGDLLSSRVIAQPLSAALSFAGDLAKRANTALAGELSFAGTLTNRAGKALSGGLSFAGAVSIQPTKALAGALTFSGSVVKMSVRALDGALSFAGDLIGSLIPGGGGGTVFEQPLTAALTFSGSLIRQTRKTVSGALTFAGELARRPDKALVGAVAFVGDLVKQPTKALAGALTFAGGLVKGIRKVLSAAVSFVGSLTGGVAPPPASGSVTVTHILPGRFSTIGRVIVEWVGAEGTGTVPPARMPVFAGALVALATNPGSPAPTEGYAVTLVDVEGNDRLQGVGTARSATESESDGILYPGVAVNPRVTRGDVLDLQISGNAVSLAAGRAILDYAARP